MTSLLDIVPTVLDWFNISYPKYGIHHKHNTVQLTGKSVLPVLDEEPIRGWDTVYASHNLHEITMYYPMRVIRTRLYKLIHNLNHKMPFPIDQDFYLSPSFQDLLNRTRNKEPLHWFKDLREYYYRDPWELYDVKSDPGETKNLATNSAYHHVLESLQRKLNEWQNVTADPWICSPLGVLEASGLYKAHPKCLPLDNYLDDALVKEEL